MIGQPQRNEAVQHYFTYIDKAQTADIIAHLDAQTEQLLSFFATITEERSLHRYETGKWSYREALNHITDTERVFGFRAFWFSRGAQTPLPGFDQDQFASHSPADSRSWASHIEEFRAVRAATMSFVRSLPAEAWSRTGIASDNPITVNALIYAIAGHAEHHRQILAERYA